MTSLSKHVRLHRYQNMSKYSKIHVLGFNKTHISEIMHNARKMQYAKNWDICDN